MKATRLSRRRARSSANGICVTVRHGGRTFELRADERRIDDDDTLPVELRADGKPAGEGYWSFEDDTFDGSTLVPERALDALRSGLRKIWDTEHSMRVWFLDTGPRATSSDISRFGGLPFGVAADSWPRNSAGQPKRHVLTLDVRGLDLPVPGGCVALSYFEDPMPGIVGGHEGTLVWLEERDLKRGVPAAARSAHPSQARRIRLRQEIVPICRLRGSYVGGIPTDRNGEALGTSSKTFLFQLERDDEDEVTHVHITAARRAVPVKASPRQEKPRPERPRRSAPRKDRCAQLVSTFQLTPQQAILTIEVEASLVDGLRGLSLQVDDAPRREWYDIVLLHGPNALSHVVGAAGLLRSGSIIAWCDDPPGGDWPWAESLRVAAENIGLEWQHELVASRTQSLVRSLDANLGLALDTAERWRAQPDRWFPAKMSAPVTRPSERKRLSAFIDFAGVRTLGIFEARPQRHLFAIAQAAPSDTQIRSTLRLGRETLDSAVYVVAHTTEELSPPTRSANPFLRQRSAEFMQCCKRLRLGGHLWVIFDDPGPAKQDIAKCCAAQGFAPVGTMLTYERAPRPGARGRSALRFRKKK